MLWRYQGCVRPCVALEGACMQHPRHMLLESLNSLPAQDGCCLINDCAFCIHKFTSQYFASVNLLHNNVLWATSFFLSLLIQLTDSFPPPSCSPLQNPRMVLILFIIFSPSVFHQQSFKTALNFTVLFSVINFIFFGTRHVSPISHPGVAGEALRFLHFQHRADGVDSFLPWVLLASQGRGHDTSRAAILYCHVTLQVDYSGILRARILICEVACSGRLLLGLD